MANLPPDGLRYDPDITTQEEIDTFRAFYKRTKGYSLPAFEFWLDLRPDVLKRYRANYRREVSSAEERLRPIPHVLAMLHYYVIVGYGDGVLYELKLAQSEGAARGECLDAMAFAFINAGPMGMDAAGASSLEFMKNWLPARRRCRQAAGHQAGHLTAMRSRQAWISRRPKHRNMTSRRCKTGTSLGSARYRSTCNFLSSIAPTF